MDQDLRNKVVKEIGVWDGLLNLRVDFATELFRKQKYSSDLENSANVNRNVSLVRNLKNFSRVTSFLGEKIGTDSENAQMYLCQLRTLSDIMSRIVFILSLEIEDAARVCICDDSINSQKIDIEIFTEHFKEVIIDNPLFSEIADFPDVESMSRTKLVNLQKSENLVLVFPLFEERLDSDYINSKTFNIAKQFGVSLRSALLSAHTSFSHHVHGNHLFVKEQGNEVFWLSMYCLTLVPYLCEIVDGELLEKERAADISKQTKTTLELRKEIVSVWKKPEAKKGNS